LHYVFDLWAQRWRTRPGRGEIIVVRYADDFIVGFQRIGDATKFLDELRARVQAFALELHPEKTRLIRFGRFARQQRAERDERRPETFNFLGFTHVCGENRRGNFTLVRRTMRTRMTAKLHEVKVELLRRRHQSIPTQGEWLGNVVRGFFAYHAVPANGPALEAFRSQVKRHWKRALSRRSQRARVDWRRMRTLADRLAASTSHSSPLASGPLRRKEPRQEPSAVVPLARIRAGGGPVFEVANPKCVLLPVHDR
jgi:hypothetical protein